jgi:putative ABC transport system ATP-binding protein
MNTTVICARALTFSFPQEDQPVLTATSFSAGSEVVAVTGASGSGKTTLLLCLAGILVPSSGEITVAGERLDGANEAERSRIRRQKMGLVFQFSELVAELTLVENVALPRELLGESRRAALATARQLLDELGIAELADRHPGQVSGGQAQRAAVARALVHDPAVVLADEPTGALDAANADKVLSLLLAAARRRDTTVVLVTHDRDVAAHADREVHLPALSDVAAEPGLAEPTR